MPLRQLADEILRLGRQGSTPVLVTPSYLSLRHRFFVELATTLAAKTDRSIRIDWCRGVPSLFSLVGDRIASLDASRLNRALSKGMASDNVLARIEITSSIARPGASDQNLVIGLCDQQLSLPAWTTSIRLGPTPAGHSTLQSFAA